jgi:hypothetical protein
MRGRKRLLKYFVSKGSPNSGTDEVLSTESELYEGYVLCRKNTAPSDFPQTEI